MKEKCARACIISRFSAVNYVFAIIAYYFPVRLLLHLTLLMAILWHLQFRLCEIAPASV